ncbi:iron complex transport system substrate-binding protein [Halolactibacillus halophilus]|uniref:ABC transporter substrate-binding protein n=1 Tax=Halolactibacillus halophilus TaxID=306540 RepID=A0A1I5PY35_9BACI|nr:iron-hydroxamate ABC transporter substrate-binding protein [Halolactibacillus halophilus]GEM02245.1 ABC transporter substrate-binding protein [Halolactibacillus halophilus]SFP38680.1 iron complex transport system substrate-binding protein [Halolactibacillus halophilus]
MKKLLTIFVFFSALILFAGCNTAEETNSDDQTNADMAEDTNETFTYESETGPVDVPTNPERVVVLAGYTGDLIKLEVNIVGVDTWSKNNPTFADELADVALVSEDNLESVIALNPDLIIALSTVKNVEQLKDIAPTVTYTWGKLNYLDQHIEIGKLLNKEAEATAWVEDFKSRATALGEEIKMTIGEDTTVSVIESFGKDLYVFGNNWGRGTEILYQTMALKMPEKVKQDALESGYFTLSQEVLPDYAGDYLVLSKYQEADTAFEETDTFKNIPAVQNGNVIEMQGEGASFTDPITLEKQLVFFKEAFLGE